MKKLLCTIGLVVLFMASYVNADWQKETYATYYGTTDNPITISWDASTPEYTIHIWFTGHSNRDNSVTYEVYDNTEVIDTVVVDQSNFGIASQWYALGSGYSITSGILKVTLITDSENSCSADAVRVSEGICDSTGIIIDNGDSGTSFTGSWSVSEGENPYGSNSVYGTDGETYTWEFSGLAPSIEGIVYEYYINSVERGFNYLNNTTTNTQAVLTIPKAGHYFFHVRGTLALTVDEIDYLQVMDRVQLQSFISEYGCEVTVTANMSDEDIRTAIVDSGKKSDWAVTNDIDSIATCIGEDVFWIYGTLAPPGPIVIE